MYTFLAEKTRLYEGDITLKTSFLISKKKHAILYDDLFAIYNTNDSQKPITLLPNECLVSVTTHESKPNQLDLMFFGKVESYNVTFLTPTPDIAKTWQKHLQNVIDPPALRTKKQVDYKDVLGGKFWEDVVGIALANRDRVSSGPVPARHVLLQGILKKRSPKAVLGHRPWQARIFVLHQDSLIYYKAKDEPPCGAIMLRDVVRISDHQSEHRMDISIRIDDGAVRLMTLQAQTYEEIAIWIDRIQKAKEECEKAIAAAIELNNQPVGDYEHESSENNSISQLNVLRTNNISSGPNFYSPDADKKLTNQQQHAQQQLQRDASKSISRTDLTVQTEVNSRSHSVVQSTSQGSRKTFSPQGPRTMRNALLDSDSDDEHPVQVSRS